MNIFQELKSRVPYAVDRVTALRQSPSDSILIVGFWNSGTTWFQQIVAELAHAKRIFEPFYFHIPAYTDIVSSSLENRAFEWPFANVYCPFFGKALRNDKLIRKYVESALTGDIRGKVEPEQGGEWVRRLRKNRLEHFRKRVVVKCVRGQFVAPAINRYYGTPVLHIWRDPRAVVASLQRRGWDWFKRESLRVLLSEGHDSRGRYIGPWLDTLKRLDAEGTFAEKTAAYWAVTERYLDEELGGASRFCSVNYDRMVLTPDSVLESVAQTLKHSLPPSIDAINKNSTTTQKSRHDISTKRRVVGWKQELTSQQIEAVEHTVEDFGMQHRIALVNENIRHLNVSE